MIKQANASRPKFYEPSGYMIEYVLITALGRMVYSPRRSDYEPRDRSVTCSIAVGCQEHMCVMPFAICTPVGFVAGEQPTHTPGVVSCEGHQGASQMAHEIGTVLRFHRAVEVEGNNIGTTLYRLHQAKTAESAVTNNKRTGNRFIEPKFHMPEGVFGEPSADVEPLGACTSTVERFPLHTDVGQSDLHASMTKGLYYCVACQSFFPAPFSGGLLISIRKSAALSTGQGDWRQSAKSTCWTHETFRHPRVFS